MAIPPVNTVRRDNLLFPNKTDDPPPRTFELGMVLAARCRPAPTPRARSIS